MAGCGSVAWGYNHSSLHGVLAALDPALAALTLATVSPVA